MHIIRYRFVQSLRDSASMFWALVFPLLLGTLFYVAFWSLGEPDTVPWQNIHVAFVDSGDQSAEAFAFRQFLDTLDNGLLSVTRYDSHQEALTALEAGDETGIFSLDERPSLEVAASGVKQNILQSLLDSYLKNEALVTAVAAEHPERLQALIDGLYEQGESVREVDLGGRTYNSMISYFLALIGFACISGAYLGLESARLSHANLTPLGMRRSVSPTSKLTLISVDLLVLVSIQFVNTSALVLYLSAVLKLPLPITPSIFLCNLVGSITGISIGILIGSLTKKESYSLSIGICIGCTVIPGFLAGLMYGNMKNILEQRAPIVNRINPAAVLSDAYYCIAVYDDPVRLQRDLLILLCTSLLLLSLAFISLRRDRYDSL